MKDYIMDMEKRIIDGYEISKCEAMRLFDVLDEDDRIGFDQLMESAGKIRSEFLGKSFELCSIINAKSGKCSEDCKYCAQSMHYDTGCKEHGILEYEEIFERANELEKKGVKRFSLVTSGRGIESEQELEKLCRIYERLSKETSLLLCASHGIISKCQAERLKEAGATRYHHNLETSSENYGEICTTHSYKDRVDTIKNALAAGMQVCSGGIFGLGENMEDRVEMALELRRLGIRSVPLNILMPVEKTPLENAKGLSADELLASMAAFRFILPRAHIRYAGGRMKLSKRQEEGISSSMSAALVGDYLTTLGSDIDGDREMIERLGFEMA